MSLVCPAWEGVGLGGVAMYGLNLHGTRLTYDEKNSFAVITGRHNYSAGGKHCLIHERQPSPFGRYSSMSAMECPAWACRQPLVSVHQRRGEGCR